MKQYGTICNQVLFCFYFGLFVYWTYNQPNTTKTVLQFMFILYNPSRNVTTKSLPQSIYIYFNLTFPGTARYTTYELVKILRRILSLTMFKWE